MTGVLLAHYDGTTGSSAQLPMRRDVWGGSYVYPSEEFVDLLFAVSEAESVEVESFSNGNKARPADDSTKDEALEDISNQLTTETRSAVEHQLQMRSHIRKLVVLMQGRTLCANDENTVLNCPDDAELGDLVVVFATVNTPFVIRPLNSRIK